MSNINMINTSVTNFTHFPVPTSLTDLSNSNYNLTNHTTQNGSSTAFTSTPGYLHTNNSTCGNCQLFVPEVQLYVWSLNSCAGCSSDSTTDDVSLQASTGTISSSPERFTTQSTSVATTVVVDGSALTYPSYYLAIDGDVSVRDSCGVRGKTYHNPTIAIAPSDFSTLSCPTNAVQSNGSTPLTSLYDPAACHTYSLDSGSLKSIAKTDFNASSAFTSQVLYSMGDSFSPILLPPQDFSNLDPKWQACTSWGTYGSGGSPPRILVARVLTRASALVDSKSTSLSHDQPPLATVAPSPAATPSLPLAEMTSTPAVSVGSDLSTSQPIDPSFDYGLPAMIFRPFRKDSSPDAGSFESQGPQLDADDDDLNSLIMKFASSTLAADQAGNYFAKGQTIPATTIITIDGTPVSLVPNSNAFDIEGTTQNSKYGDNARFTTTYSPSLPSLLTLGGFELTPEGTSNFLIEGQTLSPGSQITVQGTPISLASDRGFAILAGSTQSLPLETARIDAASYSGALPPSAIEFLTIGSDKYAADADSGFTIASQRLAPGIRLILSSDVTLSLSQNGATAVAIVDGSSQTLTLELPGSITTNNPKALPSMSDNMLIFDGQAYSAQAVFAFTIAGQTLTPGAQMILPLQATLSLYPNGATAVAIADGSTKTLLLSTSIPSNVAITAFAEFSATPVSGSQAFIIDGQTLTPGGKLTVDGEIISWEGANTMNGGDVIVFPTGTGTEASETGLTEATVGFSTETGLGGNRTDGATATGAVIFEGAAVRAMGKGTELGSGIWLLMVVIVTLVMMYPR